MYNSHCTSNCDPLGSNNSNLYTEEELADTSTSDDDCQQFQNEDNDYKFELNDVKFEFEEAEPINITNNHIPSSGLEYLDEEEEAETNKDDTVQQEAIQYKIHIYEENKDKDDWDLILDLTKEDCICLQQEQDSTTASQCKFPAAVPVSNIQLVCLESSSIDTAASKNNKKPFVCTWPNCDKQFTRRYDLKIHQRKHTGEKPYACDWPDCKQQFTQRNSLKVHQRIHTGEKPFSCDWLNCNQRFSQPSHLNYHKTSHTVEKPFICAWPNCGKQFVDVSTLNRHKKKSHTGEKTFFICDWPNCGKRFMKRNEVVYHKNRNHTGEKKLPSRHLE